MPKPADTVALPPTEDPKVAQLFALAAELGYDLTPSTNHMKELALSMLTRMRTRGSKHIYQSAAYHLCNFPRSAIEKVLPETFVTLDSESVKTWEMTTVKDLQSTLGLMLDEYGYDCAGISRALCPASQSFVLVLATLLPPCVISHVAAPRGVDRLYVNLQYVLTDEAGEMHKPKDEKRIEIAIEPDVEAAMRVAVLNDARAMSQNSFKLSPMWLAQIGVVSGGEPESAAVTSTAIVGPKPKRKRAGKSFDVEAILEESDECYLVRWEGYRPSWERWRISGSKGDPLETWEPKINLEHSLALERWEAG